MHQRLVILLECTCSRFKASRYVIKEQNPFSQPKHRGVILYQIDKKSLLVVKGIPMGTNNLYHDIFNSGKLLCFISTIKKYQTRLKGILLTWRQDTNGLLSSEIITKSAGSLCSPLAVKHYSSVLQLVNVEVK